MGQVFERCQEMERQRLKFFKEMLLGVHKCLDISNEQKSVRFVARIYSKRSFF